MLGLVERLGREGTTRADVRKIARKGESKRRGRPRHFVLRFNPRGSDVSLNLGQFKRPHVEKDEVIRALEAILDALRKEG